MIFRCRDYDGRSIELPADIWHDKIVWNHPEMDGNQYAIEETLRNPDCVNYDEDLPDEREVYYRKGVLPHPYHEDLLKVVVELKRSVRLTRYGVVISAYPTDERKGGERTKWQRGQKRKRRTR